MDTSDYIKVLREEQRNEDIEVAHANADTILCNLLIELNYKDVVSEYRKIDKWFA